MSVQLDGTSGIYGSLPAGLTGPFTIMTYSKSYINTEHHTIVSLLETATERPRALQKYVSTGKVDYVEWGTDEVMWTWVDGPLEQWNLSITVHVDGSERYHWVNEVKNLPGDVGGTSPIVFPSEDLDRIAVGTFNGVYYFLNGAVAEVALWNTALSDTDVGLLFNGDVPSTVGSGLIGHWPLVSSGVNILNPGTNDLDQAVGSPTYSSFDHPIAVIANPTITFSGANTLRGHDDVAISGDVKWTVFDSWSLRTLANPISGTTAIVGDILELNLGPSGTSGGKTVVLEGTHTVDGSPVAVIGYYQMEAI